MSRTDEAARRPRGTMSHRGGLVVLATLAVAGTAAGSAGSWFSPHAVAQHDEPAPVAAAESSSTTEETTDPEESTQTPSSSGAASEPPASVTAGEGPAPRTSSAGPQSPAPATAPGSAPEPEGPSQTAGATNSDAVPSVSAEPSAGQASSAPASDATGADPTQTPRPTTSPTPAPSSTVPESPTSAAEPSRSETSASGTQTPSPTGPASPSDASSAPSVSPSGATAPGATVPPTTTPPASTPSASTASPTTPAADAPRAAFRRSVAGADKVLYLTFGDGPHPTFTPQMLDLLARHDAKATFFMVGKEAQRFGHLVPTVRRAGHAVGNHSLSHPDLTTLTMPQVREQLESTRALIGSGSCLRAPYGEVSDAVHVAAAQAGYTASWHWSVDARDWTEPGTTQIADAIVQGAAPGAVYVLHDGGINRTQTVQGVDRALTRLESQGWRFESLPGC